MARERHDSTALNPREFECKSIDPPHPHSRTTPTASVRPSPSSYLPVVSLRTLPPFVALSRPFWCAPGEAEGRTRARLEGTQGEGERERVRGRDGRRVEERSDSTRGRARENSPSIFLAGQQHRREPFPPRGRREERGLDLLFLLASFVLLIIRLSDRRYSITSGGFRGKTIKTRPGCMNLCAFYRRIESTADGEWQISALTIAEAREARDRQTRVTGETVTKTVNCLRVEHALPPFAIFRTYCFQKFNRHNL